MHPAGVLLLHFDEVPAVEVGTGDWIGAGFGFDGGLGNGGEGDADEQAEGQEDAESGW